MLISINLLTMLLFFEIIRNLLFYYFTAYLDFHMAIKANCRNFPANYCKYSLGEIMYSCFKHMFLNRSEVNSCDISTWGLWDQYF